jgi:1-acyl-sn-glycerol-3-phosphate acyltransferase
MTAAALEVPARRLPRSSLAAALQRALVRPFARWYCAPFTVSGLDHLEALDGPAVFAPNHQSHADTLALLAALPGSWRGRVKVAAAEDYFFRHWLLGSFLAVALNAFAFRRRGHVRAGLDRAAALLAEGWSLLLFPEGTRSVDGRVGPFLVGAVRLAVATEAPLVPVHIEGTRACLPKGRRWPRRVPVTVRFGAPLEVSRQDGPRAAADHLRTRVLVLGASSRHATTGRVRDRGG